MTATALDVGTHLKAKPPAKRPLTVGRVLMYIFLTVMAVGWLIPLVWALYTSFRPYSDTAKRGYVSLPGAVTFDNFSNAWTQAELPRYYLNTIIVTVPALVVTLLLASMVAFGVARFSWRGNILLLMIFTAGNLLPQQVIITPLFQLYKRVPLPAFMSDSESLYDSYWGIILIHVAFQLGFCSFVLSNYMKTLPESLTEAALMDGAGVWRQYWGIVLPLCRAPIAALATLEFTWIYNDFFWALVLMNSGDKRPITSGLNNLQGTFFTNNNLIAAGALMAAVPTLVVYFALQKHFIAGLTLGADKG